MHPALPLSLLERTISTGRRADLNAMRPSDWRSKFRKLHFAHGSFRNDGKFVGARVERVPKLFDGLPAALGEDFFGPHRFVRFAFASFKSDQLGINFFG